METTKQKFNRALRNTRKEGIKVLQNVQECCRSCITSEKLGLTDDSQPYAFTYGGQGSAYRWLDNGPVTRKHWAPVKVIYFNHDNGAAEVLFRNLKAEGLNVTWSGSDYQCVTVTFE